MKRFFLSCFLFLICFYLFANGVGYSKVSGITGMIFPVKNKNLDMVKEEINIDIYLFSPDHPGLFYVEFSCVYNFKNTGSGQSFLMGFPLDYGYDRYRHEIDEIGTYHFVDPQITDFQLKIDDKKTDFKLYTHGFNPELSAVNYDEAYGFDLYLKKNETKVVEIKYSQIIASFMEPTINYIFKSGTLLKNPIGTALINVYFHFPVDALRKRINFSHEGNFRTNEIDAITGISWEINNFIPESDLKINLIDLIYDGKDVQMPSFENIVNRIQTQHSIQSYFYLIYLIEKKKIEIDKKEKDFFEIMRDFYNYYFLKDELYYNLAGFFMNDIIANPDFSPGSSIINNADSRIKNKAILHSSDEIDRIRNIAKTVDENQLDSSLVQKAETLLYSPYKKRTKHNQYSLENKNLFIHYIAEAKKTNDYQKSLSGLEESILNANIKQILQWISGNINNYREITRYISYYKLSFEIKKMATEYTRKLWNKKGLDKEARSFENLLAIIDIMGFTFYMAENNEYGIKKYVSAESFPIPADRDMLRMAYYCLANYYFGSDFNKAIFYYKVAIVFGQKSPFLDYFDLQSPGGGPGKPFYIYKSNEKVDYSRVQKPLWEYDIPVPDLINPDILLKVNVKSWSAEPENMAPCYYIAYNLACAYSRIKNAERALSWLKVAFLLNRELKNIASKDNDLLYLKNNLPDEYYDLLHSE